MCVWDDKGLVISLKSHDGGAAVIACTGHRDGHRIHQGNADQHSLHDIQRYRRRADEVASTIVERYTV